MTSNGITGILGLGPAIFLRRRARTTCRARRLGGNISAAAARESWMIPPEPPISARPTETMTPDVAAQPNPTTPHPIAPPRNAARMTNIRP
jgi:hypothetical protein